MKRKHEWLSLLMVAFLEAGLSLAPTLHAQNNNLGDGFRIVLTENGKRQQREAWEAQALKDAESSRKAKRSPLLDVKQRVTGETPPVTVPAR